jgi:hypothetical protein
VDAFGLKPVEMGSAGHNGKQGTDRADGMKETFRVERTSAWRPATGMGARGIAQTG